MDDFNNNSSGNNYERPFVDYQNASVQSESHTINHSGDEVSYNPLPEIPKKKKHIGIKILKAVGCIACAVVISFGSIAGYVALTDNGYKVPFITKENEDADVPAETTETTPVTDTVRDTNLPTLIQLASKDNALTVPEIVKKVTPSVVGVSSTLTNGTSTGTGIVMTSDGYIVTNNHVIADATAISVAVKNGNDYEEYTAKLIGSDEQTDLAVIKIDKNDLTPAEFGTSGDLLVGELAIAIGNPLGYDFASSVTAGIISGLDRNVTIENRDMTLIQTDAAINNGNSGGPLVNSYGQVVGINSVKISQLYAEGLGFAIPMDSATPIINDLIKYGYVTGRPYIGIIGQEINQYTSIVNDIPQGIAIMSVEDNSGAAKAGLKRNDIIFGVEGKTISTMAELNEYKEGFKAGDTIKLFIYRDGQTFEVNVTLSESKPDNK